MPFGFNFDSFRRQYNKGWKPHANRYTSRFSTIRDSGEGSGKSIGYKPRAGEEPKSFEDLKAELLEAGALWEDPEFGAEDSSLYYKDPPSAWPDIEWMRPSEMCDDPQMFVDGASRLDVNQGILGDCWLLAAVSCLATNETLLHRVIPNDQNFTDDYAGVFKFNFWQYGRWVEVMIDDRLPCKNGKLIYMHSDDRNEFWSALIEKAYAKLTGSYEALSGGLTSEALTDFTGGLVERFQMRDDAPEDLFKRMHQAHQKCALMGCSIDASPDQMEAQLDNGLIIGHAYSITGVRYVEVETPRVSGRVPMVRVRNPWGDSHEWQGAWGDSSEEWQLIPEDEREEMGLNFSHDGEFWMSFDDFKTEFQRLEICYLGPDSKIADDSSKTKWEGTLHEGGWKRRVNAGGCRNYINTFWTNPQYKIHIDTPDEGDEDGNGSIVVGLMQKNRRKMRAEGKDNLTIGYAIYNLADPDVGTLSKRYFQTHASSARSPQFINMREVSDHHTLPPGDYVVVPSTFEPDDEGDFVLRVFSEVEDDVAELDDSTGVGEVDAEELGEDDPAEEEEAVEKGSEAFRNLAGEDGEIDAYELRDILNQLYEGQFSFDGFSADMTRSMVAMFDADLSGKLDFSDFQMLWKDLMLCKKAFTTLDQDGNGYFNSYEFRHVLNAIGLRVSNSTFNAIVMRYSDKEGHVRFDDFVACVIKLKTMFQTYKKNDEDMNGTAEFGLDEFVQLTMYS